jgi:hypothetical protein
MRLRRGGRHKHDSDHRGQSDGLDDRPAMRTGAIKLCL